MAAGDEGYLKQTYGLETPEQVGVHYDRWAETYEQELLDNGYVTPARCARALAHQADDLSAPVLDVGCGTGLSGRALREAGFSVIDGNDFSDEMLRLAAHKEGVYRSLALADLRNPIEVAPGSYANACAAGVIHPGHAPVAAIGYVLDALAIGGCFALSLNDHAFDDPQYAGAVADYVDQGRVDVVFEEHGDHIPGIGLESRVYVLRRRA